MNKYEKKTELLSITGEKQKIIEEIEKYGGKRIENYSQPIEIQSQSSKNSPKAGNHFQKLFEFRK